MKNLTKTMPVKNAAKAKAPFDYKKYKWLFFVLIAIIAVYLLTIPLRSASSDGYIQSGDKLLSEKKYLSADLEYQKAGLLSEKTSEERQALVSKASGNILELESFYKEKGDSEQIAKFEKAKAIPTNESDAVKASKELIQEEEFQLAIIPAKTATEMDQNYRDAWLYLGIANLKAAFSLELKPEIRNGYIADAVNAFDKAKQIDPNYQPTLDYLNSLNNTNR